MNMSSHIRIHGISIQENELLLIVGFGVVLEAEYSEGKVGTIYQNLGKYCTLLDDIIKCGPNTIASYTDAIPVYNVPVRSFREAVIVNRELYERSLPYYDVVFHTPSLAVPVWFYQSLTLRTQSGGGS